MAGPVLGSAGPGDARLRRIAPNPAGAAEALFAIDGDFTRLPGRLVAGTVGDLPPTVPGRGRLRLFHVNDLHNHLCDLRAGRPETQRLAQMVARIGAARAVAAPDEAVLFLSAGDDHTGTVFDELLGWGAADFVLDPGYRALSAAGLDAATIGNHEVDRGTAQLVRGIEADAAFPVLSANIHSSSHLVPGRHYHAALIAVTKGLRIGILGLTTRVETRVGQPSDPGLALASPVAVLENLLPVVTPLCDLVVVLSHCGYGDGAHASGKAVVARDIGEADFALAAVAARLCDRPAVVIGAHTHTRLNEHGVEAENIRHGILIAQAECNGRFLGEVLLDTAGGLPQARLHPVAAGAPHDAAFAEAHIAPLAARVAERMANRIGEAPGNALGWAETRSRRYSGECALANYMNDALVAALAGGEDAVDLAMLNGGSLLSGVGPGPVTFGDWFDVMPYADEIFVLRATGREIGAILASNAQRLLRADEGHIDPSGFVARGFLHGSAGLRYRILPGASAAEARVTEVALFGRPLAERLDDSFAIAMTTYLALGSFGERWNGAPLAGGISGDLPGFDLRALPQRNTGRVYRDVLVAHIRANPVIAASCDGRLQIGAAG